MPYYITDKLESCNGWAVVKDDGDALGCHKTKQGAIDQMVAISIQEGIEPGGEKRAAPGTLAVGDYVSWNSSGGRARGEISKIVEDGQVTDSSGNVSVNGSPVDPAVLIQVYQEEGDGWIDTDVFVAHKMSALTKIDPLPEPTDEPDDMEDDDEMSSAEYRKVDLTPPAYMRAAARRGLKYYEEGYAGDGLVDRTVDEARAMAAGNVTADKWVRIAAWIARHMPDLDAPKNSNKSDPEYPGPGLVAHLLWGSGPSKRQAMRAMEFAQGVVARLEEEKKERGASLKKETRNFDADFEIRESGNGMTFVGYAAKFNSRSENLGGFVETIEPGAFRRTLQSRNDVKLLVNHDTGRVLASTRSGTLRLSEDSVGLKVEADLPNTTDGRDMAELLRRGDLSSMSFGFNVIKDSWSSDGTERTLKSVRLFETSIVAFPAYMATEAAVRSYDALATRAEVDSDTLADALLKLEEGEDLTLEQAELLKSVVEKLAPATEESAEVEQNNIELKKKQLELLLKRV